MSDSASREKLYGAFFGDIDPPSDVQIPSLWDIQEGLSGNTNLRKLVLREYERRHRENGLSELIELRDYLSERHGKLEQQGEEPWEKSKELEQKVRGVPDPQSGEWVKEPSATPEEKEKFRRLRDRAASLLSKAEIVRYRLSVLKLYLWRTSVRGEYPISNKIGGCGKKDNESGVIDELLVKRKAMLCVLDDIVNIEALKGKLDACQKMMDLGIGDDIGEKSNPDSIRSYLTKKADNFPSNTIEMKKIIKEWKNDDDVNAIYSKIKRSRGME